MNNYFLIPSVCIQYKNGKFFLKNALYNYEKIEIDNLNKLYPEKNLLEAKIFAKKSEVKRIKEEMFNVLENKFMNSPVGLGYIETTSICPYKCKMCPKGRNKLERDVSTMSIEMFQSIIDALIEQDDITLHLFGDPLYDNTIYEKIFYANRKGIMPSFSTNLVSLKRLKLNEIRNVKLKYMTVSFDSIISEEFSQIRGSLTEKQMRESWHCLETIIAELDNNKFIEKICLQSINFENNKATRERLREYVKKKEVLEFYEKPYIEFPDTDKVTYASSNIYSNNEWMWFYNILDMKTPYKCMKPWSRKQTAILSDGKFVPCCMSYNDKSNLGSILDEDLERIQSGERFLIFRKNIWSGNDCGSICNSCSFNQNKIIHSEISVEDIEYLRNYCIDIW